MKPAITMLLILSGFLLVYGVYTWAEASMAPDETVSAVGVFIGKAGVASGILGIVFAGVFKYHTRKSK